MLGLDRATIYAMGNRLAGTAGGLVTALLVATLFSAELQGFYYTFLSLLTLQTLAELGVGELVQQSVSHEWARSESPDRTVSARARARLAALARWSLAWYAVVALVVVAGLGAAGRLYFDRFASADALSWKLAWWAAVLATGASVLLTPVLVLLEGANRVESVYRTRCAQAVFSRMAGAVAIVTGAGLFTIAIARFVSIASGVAALGRTQWSTFKDCLVGRDVSSLSWRSEMWPLQWRLALSWLSGYLFYSLFTPVVFAFDGPVTAGRIGLTLAATGAIASAAFAAVATKVPRLAYHAATGDYDEMDALFRRATLSSVAVATGGGALFLAGVVLARAAGLEIATRFLPPLETALLLAAVSLQQVRFAMGSYLRAHKKDPFVGLSLGEALVGVPLLVFLARGFGPIGIVSGFVAISTLTLIPAVLTFEHCRNLWHRGGVAADAHSV